VIEEHSRQVGAIARLTKQISEADVALFELVTRDEEMEAGEPPKPDRRPRQAAPFPLVAAMLASAAGRHQPTPGPARFVREEVSFAAPAYTDDTLCAVAEITGYDGASHTLRVSVHCENQEGLRLAEGCFYLSDD
jgi:hypothetical protein